MPTAGIALAALVEIGQRIANADALEDVADITLSGVTQLLGEDHALLLVHHVETDRLVTLASRGYDRAGIGSEVSVGEGVFGMAAASRRTMRVGNVQRMLRYADAVARSASGGKEAELLLPRLPNTGSQLAAPLVARGVLVGVLAVESARPDAFGDDDELALSAIGHLVAQAFDREQAGDAAEGGRVDSPGRPAGGAAPAGPPQAPARVRLRHYTGDGSTFVDDDYVIKGVAGRLLWKLAREHADTGRVAHTNREVRLDESLDLPSFRDNFESRLVLLKRRLEERDLPMRIVSTGRGRFDFEVAATLDLERIDAT